MVPKQLSDDVGSTVGCDGRSADSNMIVEGRRTDFRVGCKNVPTWHEHRES